MNNKKATISILAISLGNGGAEKVISLLLPHFVRDFRVVLVLFNDDFHYEVPKDVEIIVLNNNKHLGRLKKSLLFPLFCFQYLKILKSLDIVTSISFLTRPNLLNCILKIIRPKTSTIISERCYPSIAYKGSFFRYWFYRIIFPLLYNRSDVIFSNSMYINEDLKQNFKVTRPVFQVIYNPVDMNATFNDRSISERSYFNVVYVGKLNRIKNPTLLLRAFNYTNNTDSKSITFVGDGPLKEELESFSINNDLASKVEFVGKVKDVHSYLRKSDCFVLTSNSEGFPNSLLEALQSGLSVISTNCMSGPLEILNENEPAFIAENEFYIAKYGILINVDDHVALAKAINYLAEDHNVRDQLSKKALSRSLDYSSDRIYIKLKEIINSN